MNTKFSQTLKRFQNFPMNTLSSSLVCPCLKSLNRNCRSNIAGLSKFLSHFFINKCAIGVHQEKCIIVFLGQIKDCFSLVFKNQRFTAGASADGKPLS